MEIVCYYVGYGHLQARQCAELMVRTARRSYPEAKFIHLTDKHTPKLAGFDSVARSPENISWDDCIGAKGQLLMAYAKASKDTVLFLDPDIVINKRDPVLDRNDFDIAITYRRSGPHKVFNGGYIVTRPHKSDFHDLYIDAVGGMKRQGGSWWDEQLAWALLLGIYQTPGTIIRKHGSRILIRDFYEVSPKPQSLELHDTPALHFTGNRKVAMATYCEKLFC